MKAKKLPSGNWRARAAYRDSDGRQHTKSFTASTRKEAEFLANQFLYDRESYFSADCTISDAIDRYISSREALLSPSTLREYKRSQKRDYNAVNNLIAQSVTSEQLQRFVNNLSLTRSPKTVKNIYGLLKAALKAINPAKAYYVTLPQQKPHEYHLPTDDDVKHMIENADDEMKKAIILAAVGTMRRGEISASTYADIKDNTLHVHADTVMDINGKWVVKEMPKTASSDRYIKFSRVVIEQLGTGDGNIVNLTPQQISDRFFTIKKNLGLRCRFHDLRHYAASILHAIGVPDQYIMERGGWSSDATLKSVYRNTLSDKSREFSDRANDYLDDMLF